MSFAHKSRAMNVACKAANSTPVNASRHGTALVPLRVQSTLECPWFYFLITLWNRLRNSDSVIEPDSKTWPKTEKSSLHSPSATHWAPTTTGRGAGNSHSVKNRPPARLVHVPACWWDGIKVRRGLMLQRARGEARRAHGYLTGIACQLRS